MPELQPDSAETCSLLERISRGDRQALEMLLVRHRPDLHSFVEFRLGRRLAARVDSSDVVQEAQMEIARRMDDFLKRRPMPFHLWARKTAYDCWTAGLRPASSCKRRSWQSESPVRSTGSRKRSRRSS
jgi:RNA polymerase sigma-70 factor (ECF subfamily)